MLLINKYGMKNLTKTMMLLLSVVIITLSACSKNDEQTGATGKPKIENLAITPADGLTYGDVVTLSGDLSDDTELSSYNIQISNAGGVIYEVQQQMLTGTSFSLSKSLVIPIMPDPVSGDLTLNLTVTNSGGELTSQNLLIKNIKLPFFPNLYIVLNGTTYEMARIGSIFVFENFIPAGATGKIYAKADRTGLFWGSDDGTNVKVLGTNDFTFGRSDEEFFKISFDPMSFVLKSGDSKGWAPMTNDDLYILGTISGNSDDNAASMGNPDGITTEKNKMKMTGSFLGSRKRWIWSPPNTGSGSVEDDMGGQTSAGVFRLKKAGQEEYIVYSAGQIVITNDNSLDNNFSISVDGKFSIEVTADETGFTSVKAFDDESGKNIEYQNGKVLINGVPANSSIGFAGGMLNLVPGSYFVYQGTIDLTNGQSVTGDGIDLAALIPDEDVFDGRGNTTWTFKGPTSSYYVRIDAFSGYTYIRETTEYPTAI